MWDARRWLTAIAAALVVGLVIAIPTALIPNPIFGRSIEPTWWAYPITVITAILGGMVLATYLRGAPTDESTASQGQRGVTIGGLLAYFAVGCPVCNKIVLIALGTTGAVQWFAPIQPLLAVAGIVAMAWALLARLSGSVACTVPDGQEQALQPAG